ncbi:MAG: hypothetical protein WCL34_09665 [Methylococcaceae bacterium]|jgi:hypothetical protein
MTEKTASKHLINLQSTFAINNPVLQNAIQVFQELDQFEYDLGLLGDDETTAIQTSWWPIVSVIGGNSGEKEIFLARYLNVELSQTHKTTVLLHNAQANQTILPATALDVDFRYPFYRISQKLEQIQKGEAERINTHLELRTLNSARLQGKLIINIPNFIHATNFEVSNLLTTYSMEQADVVLVFCDIFNSTTDLAKALISTLVHQQESNKLVYLFDDTTSGVTAWQKKLADLGLTIGQFIGTSQLENQASADFVLLEQRLANAGLQRSYRVLHSLEKSILDVDRVLIHEVKAAQFHWKEGSVFSSLVVLGFFAMLAVFAEVAGMGFLELLIDPIVGSAMILTTVAFMIPTHILFSKMVAKMTIRTLTKRQKQLHLTENLITLFEKNITFSRMMLPINEPVGWNKKSKAQLANLLSKAKDLVQSLNDNFSIYNSVSASTLASISPTITQSERSISPTITMSESVISTTIPQTSTPQRQSALMQKILKK